MLRRGLAMMSALSLALFAFAAGCGKSGYQYVKNDDKGVLAKLPDDWTVYDEADLFRTSTDETIDPAELDQRIHGAWFRGFDSSDEPSLEGAFEMAADEPRGFMQVQPLTSEQRNLVNLSVLRQLPSNGTIPISVTDNSSDTVQVLSDEPAEFDGGYHGVHTVVALSQGSGSDIAILDETVVLDKTNSAVYMFVVSCNRRCYLDTHKDEIQDLIGSWTIQEDLSDPSPFNTFGDAMNDTLRAKRWLFGLAGLETLR